jgi:hypothetical protein
LSNAELAPIVSAAEARWEAFGVSASKFSNVQFQIANMGHGVLGNTSGSVITIDTSADGFGWSVDPSANPAAGRMDLLTVVEHELGHILGLPDLVAGPDDNVMTQTLKAGVRRVPSGVDARLAALTKIFAELGSGKRRM